jgi:hypothetical protein
MDILTHLNLWRIAVQIHQTPGFGYVEVTAAIVGTSLYIQHKQKQNGGDGKMVRRITYIALGAVMIEIFMTILHRSAAILI